MALEFANEGIAGQDAAEQEERVDGEESVGDDHEREASEIVGHDDQVVGVAQTEDERMAQDDPGQGEEADTVQTSHLSVACLSSEDAFGVGVDGEAGQELKHDRIMRQVEHVQVFALNDLVFVAVRLAERLGQDLLALYVVLVAFVEIVDGSYGDDGDYDAYQVERADGESVQRSGLLDLYPARVQFEVVSEVARNVHCRRYLVNEKIGDPGDVFTIASTRHANTVPNELETIN